MSIQPTSDRAAIETFPGFSAGAQRPITMRTLRDLDEGGRLLEITKNPSRQPGRGNARATQAASAEGGRGQMLDGLLLGYHVSTKEKGHSASAKWPLSVELRGIEPLTSRVRFCTI